MSPQWMIIILYCVLSAIAADIPNDVTTNENEPEEEEEEETFTIKGFFANLAGMKIKFDSEKLSPRCSADMFYLQEKGNESRSSTSDWRQQMLDSYGKLSAGLNEGHLFWMGDFAQCTKVEVPRKSVEETGRWSGKTHDWPTEDKSCVSNRSQSHCDIARMKDVEFINDTPRFRGKYCTPNFNHLIENGEKVFSGNMPSYGTFAVCLPSTCNATEVEIIVNKNIKPMEGRVTEANCQMGDKGRLDSTTIYALIPLVILGAMVIIGTSMEVISLLLMAARSQSTKQPTKWTGGYVERIFRAFSAYSNTKNLLDTTESGNRLSFVYGLRAINLLIGHVTHYMVDFSNGLHNSKERQIIWKTIWTQPFKRGIYTVETFFFLTGFFVTIQHLQKCCKTGKLNLIEYLVHRIWRIAPTMIILLIIQIGPFERTGNGPIWSNSNNYKPAYCKQHLWENILFLTIYADNKDPLMLCTGHLWYLQVEMFFYVFSAIILYALLRRDWTAPTIWATVFILSFAFTRGAEHNVIQGISSPYDSMIRQIKHQVNVMTVPWCRMQAYLVGMLFGYLYVYHRQKFVHLGGTVRRLTWLVVAPTLFFCVFGVYAYEQWWHRAPSKHYYMVDSTFSSTAWALCIGWITMSCATRPNGLLNTFLSWKHFATIGKLSYCTYLVHMVVIAHFIYSRKETLYIDFPLLLHAWIALTVASLVFGWMLSLVVEVPAIELEKIWKKHHQKQQTHSAPHTGND